MKHVALGEVVRIDRTPATDADCRSLPYVGLEHIEKDTGRFASDYDGALADMLATQFRFTSEHVLYGKLRPYLNKVALPNFDGVCTTEILPLLPKPEKLDRTYLWAILLSSKFVGWASSNVSGANLPRLAPSLLAEYPIPLPPLAEQQRIAGLLLRADRLRRLRRYALEVSAGYLQAVFVEVFGDYIPQSQASTRMGELVTITGGGTPSREIERYFEGDIPWLTSKDMQGDYIWDTQEHITEEAIRNSATKLVPTGSILVVVKNKVLMRRLPLAITKRPLCHGQDIKSSQCSERVHPLYLAQVLKKNEQRLLLQARGANTEGLTLPMLWDVPVPVAPMALQLQFAEIVERFERLQIQQREALRQAEHLFQALLRRAFAGE